MTTIDPVTRRDAARRTLGVSGTDEKIPLRPILREHRLTIYPMVALGLLGIVDSFQGYAFSVLTPEISRTLGLSLGEIAGARTLAFLAAILAPLPIAALSQREGRRALLCLTTGIAWSIITLLTGFVTSLVALIAVLVLDGLSTGSVSALHAPLLVDSYPPKGRVRVLSGYQGLVTAGQVISPLFVAVLAGPLDLTWRGVFLAMGVTSLLTTFFAFGLRDPGSGRFDTDELRASHGAGATGAEDAGSVDQTHDQTDDQPNDQLGFFEIMHRLLLIPTIKRLAVGYLVIGILLIPFATFLSVFLEQRWALGPGERGAFFAGISAVSIVALVLSGGRAERAFSDNPARVLGLCGTALAGAVVLIGVGSLAPTFALMFVLFAAGQSLIAVLTPGLTISFLSIVDARYRPHAAAVIGIFTACGSLLGVVFLTGIDRRFGIGGSIVSLVIPGVVGALIIRSARTLIVADMDRMIDEILDGEDVRQVVNSGGHVPLLSCRGVNFSYDQMQVLFDVDFTVADGEMVALLGTNGAGKSTLLKLVSGICLPSSGTVRHHGRDITYLDAERRVRMGITQIPGGRAVFGPLDVVENLRAFGFTLGRDRKLVDAAIEECFAAFPRLHERRSSLAATLSGGEQQMLGLSKALILRPKLLLIDELSLGLAPLVVAQLLDMVRTINAAGTSVVLVEQSVNIALNLVDHAYFMEKGEIRFDGPAAELLRRDDLLRAVFLDGAAREGDRA